MKLFLFCTLLLLNITAFSEGKHLPIHDAAMKGDQKAFVDILLKDKTMLEKNDEYGHQPIHLAVKYKHFELVKYILGLGVSVDAKMKNSNTTPLILAVAREDKKLVELLISKGAQINYVSGKSSPNFKYKTGSTALTVAALNGSEEMVQFLLDKGAKVNIIGGGFYPETALDLADGSEVKKVLLENGAKTAKELIKETSK